MKGTSKFNKNAFSNKIAKETQFTAINEKNLQPCLIRVSIQIQ